jgi:hypothetical protein
MRLFANAKRPLCYLVQTQLNPFASHQIARFAIFLSLLILPCFGPILVTMW